MSDLRCADCGMQTTYGEAMLTQQETACSVRRFPGDTRHNFMEQLEDAAQEGGA